MKWSMNFMQLLYIEVNIIAQGIIIHLSTLLPSLVSLAGWGSMIVEFT